MTPLRHELLDNGRFPDADAPEHHNMKSMQLRRTSATYDFLSQGPDA